MKKALFIVLMTLLCQTMFAQVKIKTLEGSPAVLKEHATSVIDFDFSLTTWDEGQTFQRWCGDEYEDRIEIAKSAFIIAFNKNSNGLKIDNEKEDSKYRIIFEVHNIDQKAAGYPGQLSMRCYGLVHVKNIATEENLCTIRIYKLDGDPDCTTDDRLAKCFKEVGKKVATLKK